MPPRKKESSERLDVEAQTYINPLLRSSDFQVWLRPGCGKVVSISPAFGLGARHKLGYKRLMYDEIEMMDGDQMYPIEKDFGMYWFDQDENGFAVASATDGEIHFILAMDERTRNSRIEAERKYLEIKNENVDDKEHARQLTRNNLKKGSAYEADEEEHEETITI